MVRALDLEFLGRREVIAAGLFDGPRGLVLVDPGPASAGAQLRRSLADQGAELGDVRAILLTHIHLDHSGGVGTLLRDQPGIEVYVHERGAPHVVDPARLIESAGRLYGDRMQALWGDILPVAPERVHSVRGGEVLDVAGLEVRVAATPGHATHHVSYLEAASGTAFVGDTGGIRIGAPLLVLPPTPPPDVDVEGWDASLGRIRAWSPRTLFVTHFGAFADVAAHLDDLEHRLHEAAGWVRELLLDERMDDAARQSAFVARTIDGFRRTLGDDDLVRRYERAIPLEHCWEGLARYWRKRV